jgi:hypothetical protein
MTIDEVDKPEEVEIDSDGEDINKRKDANANPTEAALAKLEDFGMCQSEFGFHSS